MSDYSIDFQIQNSLQFDIYCGFSYIDEDGNVACSADLSLCKAGETKMTVSETLNRKGTANAVFVDDNAFLWTCESFSLNTDRENGTIRFEFLEAPTYINWPGGPTQTGMGYWIYVYDQKDGLNGKSLFAPVCPASMYAPT